MNTKKPSTFQKTEMGNHFRHLAAGAAVLALGAVPIAAQTNPLTNAPPPVPKWDASVALGLTVTEGNSDSILFTLTGRADKKWDQHELHLGTDIAYGESEDVKNNESFRAFGQYNYLFTDR